MKRRIYLKMRSLEEAQELLKSSCSSDIIGEESILAKQASGRVTSRPVYARFSSPSFHSAAMDGMAVRAGDTFGAQEQNPICLKVPEQAIPINTGQPMPPGRDAVIMIEHVTFLAENKIEIRLPVYPWQNVRKVGEDIVATELLFPTNHQLKPYDIGALLTGGITKIHVWERPRVWIIPTGSELIDPGTGPVTHLPRGKIMESNTAVLAAMIEQAGALPHVTSIVNDDIHALKAAVTKALDAGAHMVVINAGSSAGSRDYTAEVIEDMGKLLAHGITIMPGKPTVLGIVRNRLIIGNPGYPVSSFISFEQIVMPILYSLQRLLPPKRPAIEAMVARKIPSRPGMEEFRRGIVGSVGRKYVVTPVKKGAGSVSTLTRANCILRIPARSEGLAEGETILAELLRPEEEILNTLICTGSHDLTLDLIKDMLMQMTPHFNMASTHVGSMGGIMAVRKGLAHMAGTHLFDPETGLYNVPYLHRYLKDMPVCLITLAYRQQGLIIQNGNPKAIKALEDLARQDVTFINRQRGSGTRVLLDYSLEKAGIQADRINGYRSEEYTHMAVAVAVLSGKADAGLGILAAARALELDFIPVVEERYDLLIAEESWSHPAIQALMDIISSEDFKNKVDEMGGYSTRDTGKSVSV